MIYNSIVSSSNLCKGTKIQLRNGYFGTIFDNDIFAKKRMIKFNHYAVQVNIKDILSASIKGEWKVVR